jgi:hypothetical protein
MQNLNFYLRREAAAEYIKKKWGLPCSSKTLAKLAVVGGGPVFRKSGRYPIYTFDDLDEWVQSRISKPVRSTSEHARHAA